MNHHEGVSCDVCDNSNFKGHRYKCLICYDYDVCASCYDQHRVSGNHLSDHPMQCILTPADMELFFGGENINTEQPQSYTCPHCKQMGFSKVGLIDHARGIHLDNSLEVICPLCCSQPGGDANMVTDDFAEHLMVEHLRESRELLSLLDNPNAVLRPALGQNRTGGDSANSSFVYNSTSSNGGQNPRHSAYVPYNPPSAIAPLSPAAQQEADDVIMDMITQLTEASNGTQHRPQLSQLNFQMQLERQEKILRQRLERWAPRGSQTASFTNSTTTKVEHTSNSSYSDRSLAGTLLGNYERRSSGETSGNRPLDWSMCTYPDSPRYERGTSSTRVSPVTLMATSFETPEPVTTSYTFDRYVADDSCDTSSVETASCGTDEDDNSLFLLNTMPPPLISNEESEIIAQERADRALFTESLLMSALTLSTFEINNLAVASAQTNVNGDNLANAERERQQQQQQQQQQEQQQQQQQQQQQILPEDAIDDDLWQERQRQQE